MSGARRLRRQGGARRLAAVASAVLAVILPFGRGAAADEALPVVSADITAYPEVRLVVAAPPSLGNEVLTDAAFRVSEGGQAQVAHVEALRAEDLDLSLVIDTSGSMAGAPLAAAKAAALSFLGQLPASDEVSVIGFGASVTVVSSRSTDRGAQVKAISALAAHGPTALYDALASARAQLPAASGRAQAIVLLTDGGDTSSAGTLDTAVSALATAKVPLFAVELATADSNPAALDRLTSASAGRVVPAADPGGLSGAFDAIARHLVRQYALTYRTEAHGTVDVDVVLEAEGVRATASRHLELPAAPAAAVPAREGGGAGSPIGPWALVVGGIMCAAAMLVVLLGTLGSRAPRAVGLAARPRTSPLADAAERAELLGDTLLRRGGGMAAVSGALESAGLEMRPGELLVGVVTLDLVALALGWALAGPIAGLFLAVVIPLGAMTVVKVLARRRQKLFSNQLAETLQILSGSLRAGHGLAQGIDAVAREAESPTAEEFRRLTVDARLGRDFIEALGALADRVGGEDFQWVVQAIEIQREVGGDLAGVLDIVCDTIRDRTRIRRQASALSAEGRISAYVLLALPFGLGLLMAVTNPTFLSPLLTTGTGHVLMGMGAVLMSVGALWLRKIVKPVF